MKHLLAVLITTFTCLILAQATTASVHFNGKSLDSISSPQVCAEENEKKKKKGGEDDEEPECE